MAQAKRAAEDMLERRWRTLRITIYAKDLDVRKTTSFVAAGKFEPSGICDEYETEDERQILADYLRRSRDRIVELHSSSSWHRYGIALRRDYTLDHWNSARVHAPDTNDLQVKIPCSFMMARDVTARVSSR